MLGLPDDTGVSMNHGRPGAKDGPRAFRDALARYGGKYCVLTSQARIDLSDVRVFDAGDVKPEGSLDATHDRITARVAALLELDLIVACIGGGHDLTWPSVRAVAARFPDLSGVYYDAHLDVRETPGSGMPFRKILTETTCSELVVVGLDRFANSRDHLDWFEANGGRIANEVCSPFRDLATPHCFVSFDLDIIDVAHAPGVSAINPAGWDARTADRAAHLAGLEPRLRYFDIMELNPAYDIDGRTARLAARLFLSFVAGFALRESAS